MGLDPEAGREPQDRSGVLGNVGLVERDPHAADDIRIGSPAPQNQSAAGGLWAHTSGGFATGDKAQLPPPSGTAISPKCRSFPVAYDPPAGCGAGGLALSGQGCQ